MSIEFLLLLLIYVKCRENPEWFTYPQQPVADDYQNEVMEAIICDAEKTQPHLRLVQ